MPHSPSRLFLSLRQSALFPRFFLTFFRPVLALAFFALYLGISPALAASEFEGKASWYGTSSHSKPTACGEIFNSRDLTAAHRTLPFGTVVRVYNLVNGRQILVCITDRGPFFHNRVIDLSKRAGQALRMLRSGTARVAIESVSNAQGKPLNAGSAFYVHLADAGGARKAHALSHELEKETGLVVRALFSVQPAHPAIILCAGPYPDFSSARAAFLEIEKKRNTMGIIEGPAAGGNIPRHVPPKRPETPWRKFARRPPALNGTASQSGT